jgi:hypothetical protein
MADIIFTSKVDFWMALVVWGSSLLLICSYITATRSATSAPALSLDRLEINYQNTEILISPKDKPRFYQETQARNPNIAIDTENE